MYRRFCEEPGALKEERRAVQWIRLTALSIHCTRSPDLEEVLYLGDDHSSSLGLLSHRRTNTMAPHQTTTI